MADSAKRVQKHRDKMKAAGLKPVTIWVPDINAPGMKEQIGDVDVDDRQLGRVEAIVLSMTAQERRSPIVIDGKRRIRIAKGSGATVAQVNQLLEARKQMEKMMKQMGRGKMPALPNQQVQQTSLSATRKTGVKRKKKKAGRK